MSTGVKKLLPGQPGDAEGPVFAAPWQAKTFAMAVSLSQSGVFEWSEWADVLSLKINEFESNGGEVDADRYYELWHQTLETLVSQKGIDAG
ncbi:MAG: nitrile hydratase accessory protein [Pseudomonadota bacterium]